MNIETVMAGFFTLLNPVGPTPGDGTFVLLSRELQLIERMQPAQMPAVFQNQVSMNLAVGLTQDGYMFATFDIDWFVYCYTPSGTIPNSQVLNPLVNRVLDIMPPTGLSLTINDIHCSAAINGDLIFYEGLLGDRAVCRIPIILKVPYNAE